MATRTTILRKRYADRIKGGKRVQCGICGLTIEKVMELTIDHIVPKSLGGSSRVTNLQPAHEHCNALKADTDPYELL